MNDFWKAEVVETERYVDQVSRWPDRGRHILAHYDERSIVVYQAYRPEIGGYAASRGRFGGPFSYNRMSWIKPNFLWMMYRSGWGSKPGQEVTLAVSLSRDFFEEVLELAVPSSYRSTLFESQDEWQQAVHQSDVRLQWDPDHDPAGGKLKRRAVQLGLRGPVLERYGQKEALSVTDISAFVASQRLHAFPPYDALETPRERVYIPASVEARRKLQLASYPEVG